MIIYIITVSMVGFLFNCVLLYSFKTNLIKVIIFLSHQKYNPKDQRAKIWISMSICISDHNAPHKAHYNYQAALILSSFLWRRIFRERVLVSLVTEEKSNKESLESLKETLQMLDVDVIIVEKEEDISCVLMAQTSRILAYNYPEVRTGSMSVTFCYSEHGALLCLSMKCVTTVRIKDNHHAYLGHS